MQIIVLSPRTKLVNYAHTYRKRESYNQPLRLGCTTLYLRSIKSLSAHYYVYL